MSRDYVYERLTDTNKCWYKDYCENYGTGLCTHVCKKFTQTDYLFQLSNLPKNMWKPIKIDESGLSPDVSETLNTITQDCMFFVKSGFNLYLYGDTGVGKTSWAVKIMNNYFAAIAERNDFTPRGLYISVPSFLRDFKLYLNYQSPNWLELLNTLKTCDLVIWDDIFQTDTTKYESQIVYSYINDRQFAGKSNIFTSNLSPEQVSMVDARLHSRICEGSDCLEITGLDMRYQKTYTEFMNSEVTDDGSTTDS
jgi:DNA replication protein DnaC